MPYKNPQTNKQADRPHAEDIARFHQMDRSQYDTPGSVKYCGCVTCNEARRTHGAREKTWQGLARTRHWEAPRGPHGPHTPKETP